MKSASTIHAESSRKWAKYARERRRAYHKTGDHDLLIEAYSFDDEKVEHAAMAKAARRKRSRKRYTAKKKHRTAARRRRP